MLKTMAALLPVGLQQELKRLHFRWQIGRGTFVTFEPEFSRLETWVAKGDWVIDVGANVGHYTCRLAALVGEEGRVIAFEPVPRSFELLAANVAGLPTANVTLLNTALSQKTMIAKISIPKFGSGLDNYYEAKIDASGSGIPVLCLGLDALQIDRPVKLIKIDAEGHEAFVLQGMLQMIERDRPVLIIEGFAREIDELLAPFGYQSQILPGSPNKIFHRSRSG